MSRNISVRSELTQANIDHNECLSADGRLILTLSEKAYGLFLISGTRKINAKSIMGMMSLGLCNNEEIEIEADGSDSVGAVDAIVNYMSPAN